MAGDRMSRRHVLAALGASALAPLAACSGRATAPSAAAGTATLHWMGIHEISSMIASRAVSRSHSRGTCSIDSEGRRQPTELRHGDGRPCDDGRDRS